MKILTYSPF